MYAKYECEYTHEKQNIQKRTTDLGTGVDIQMARHTDGQTYRWPLIQMTTHTDDRWPDIQMATHTDDHSYR